MNGKRASGFVVLIGLIVFVILTAGGVTGWLWGRPALKNFVEGRIVKDTEEKFGVATKIGRVEFKLPRSVTISNVSFSSREDGSRILETKLIRATISLSKLIHRQVTISAIECDRPVISYLRRADGTTNMDALLANKGADSSSRLSVKLKRPRLVFEDLYKRKRPVRIEVSAKSAQLVLDPGKPVRVVVDVAKYSRSTMSAKGSIGLKEGDPVNMKVIADRLYVTDLKRLVSTLGVALPDVRDVEAPLMARAEIKGERGRETVYLSGFANEGNIGARRISRFTVSGSVSRDDVEIDRLELRLTDSGTVVGSARYAMKGAPGVKAEIKVISFPVDAFNGVIENWKPGITGSLTASATLEGDPFKKETLKGTGTFSSTAGRIDGVMEGQSIDYETIDGEFDIGEERVFLKKFAMRSPQMDLDLDGFIGLDGSLDMNGRAEVAKELVRTSDLKKVVSNMLPDGEKGYVFRMRVEGDFGAPKTEFSVAKTMLNGVQDQVKDAGNKVEKFMKKIF
jgi:hypothetical protein